MADPLETLDPAPEASSGIDRRVAPRRQLVNFAWWSVLPDSNEEEPAKFHAGLAQACDISESGVGLITARRITDGTRVYLKLMSPHGVLGAIGRVVYCRPHGAASHRCGIRFEIVSPTDRVLLHRITAE